MKFDVSNIDPAAIAEAVRIANDQLAEQNKGALLTSRKARRARGERSRVSSRLAVDFEGRTEHVAVRRAPTRKSGGDLR